MNRHTVIILFFLLLSNLALGQNREESIRQIDSLNNISYEKKILTDSSNLDAYLTNLEKSKQISYQKGIADSYSNIGMIYFYQGKYDLSRKYFFNAINVYEEIELFEPAANLYSLYGYSLRDRDIEKSAEFMLKGIKMAEKLNSSTYLLGMYVNYGLVKETKKEYDSAFYYFNKSLSMKKKIRDKVVYYLRAYHPTQPIAEGILTPEKSKRKNSGSDYAILNKGDTIYGKRYRSVFNRYNIIRFRTDTGKIKLPLKDVKEIYSKNKTSWVYLSPCDNRWEEYTVYLKGNVSYLWNGGPHNTYCSDMLVINNEIYPIDKHHFSDKVWGILSKCPEFEEKYKAYYNEHKDKKLFWRTRKDVKKWMEMIRFYNANCG